MSPAEFLNVTHTDVEVDERVRAARAEREKADEGRNEQRRQIQRINTNLPARWQAHSGLYVDGDGTVRMTFACACGKDEHGHNPFAGIKGPWRFEAVDPDEAAAELARKVDRVRHVPKPKTDREGKARR